MDAMVSARVGVEKRDRPYLPRNWIGYGKASKKRRIL